jgi:hypothetical protein
MQFDQLGRRDFIKLLGGAAVAWPLAARARQPAMPVIGDGARQIGWLMSFAEGDPEAAPRMQAFELGLRQLGWSLDRNVKISYRWTGARSDRADDLARGSCAGSVARVSAGWTTLRSTRCCWRSSIAAKACSCGPRPKAGVDHECQGGLVQKMTLHE